MPLSRLDDEDMLIGAPMPWLREARELMHGLRVRAHQRLASGEIDAATEDALTIKRLGRHMGNESMLIGQLVSMSIARMGGRVVAELAGSELLTSEQARALFRELQATEHDWNLTGTIGRDERFVMLDFLQRPWLVAEQDLGVMLPDCGLEKLNRNRAMRRANRIYDGAMLEYTPEASADRPKVEEARQAYERFQQWMDELEHLREWEAVQEHALERAEKVGPEAAMEDATTDTLLSVVLPAFDHAEEMAERVRMYEQLEQVAVALAGYRATEGAYPQSLADLVASEWLEQVPEDRFAEGQAVRYRLEEGEVAVYSVGSSGVDDGGKLDGDDRTDLVVGWLRE